MHLAQTMIKGTPWENQLFGDPESVSDARIVKKFRDEWDAYEKSIADKREAEMKAHVKRGSEVIKLMRASKEPDGAA